MKCPLHFTLYICLYGISSALIYKKRLNLQIRLHHCPSFILDNMTTIEKWKNMPVCLYKIEQSIRNHGKCSLAVKMILDNFHEPKKRMVFLKTNMWKKN